jgi:SAM-dependent methyltransferase
MDHETQRLLGEINQRFYAERAVDFSATRDHFWPGWERLLPLLPQPAEGRGLRVLDVGCGNGRFGRFLHEHGVATERYVGLDASPTLLEHARASLPAQACELVQVDLLGSQSEDALPRGPFELVVAFGLLHHVPAYASRRALLRRMLGRTAQDGLLVCTFWRFGDARRFASRHVPWQDYNDVAREPIDTSQLEEGDHLLGFGPSHGPPRYCHHCDDAEIDSLLEESDLEILARFDADGRSGDLNHYAVMQRTA